MQQSELEKRAKAVLSDNWTGHFTVPAANLYPHQWSWDSAFIAMGYAHYEQNRAEKELYSLFEAQWANGLVPHIVFNLNSQKPYFPGPEIWQIEKNLHAPKHQKTSGIIQPPMHATAALHIFRHAQDQKRALTFLNDLFPLD